MGAFNSKTHPAQRSVPSHVANLTSRPVSRLSKWSRFHRGQSRKGERAMKKVVQISSRRLFGQFYPQAPAVLPEGLRVTATAAFGFVAPTAAYCYVTNQLQPLYAVSILLVLGSLAGALLNWKRSRRLSGGPTVGPAKRSSETVDSERDRDAA